MTVDLSSIMNLRTSIILALLAAALAAGCGAPPAPFRRYETIAFKIAKDADIKFAPAQRQSIDESLQGLFGTPDEPTLPALEGIDIAEVMDIRKLRMAAGPVGSDEAGNPRGLYREHCAHCHGITGDGLGPTASFLNPYPRDYRKGQYKFKSTPIGRKPTHDDLKKVVLEGIPGTAMPAFALLPDLEVEALVDYVKYLSIRGEVERGLLRATTDLEEGQPIVTVAAANATAEQQQAYQEQVAVVRDIAADFVGRWSEAPQFVTEVPERPTMTEVELVESRRRGQTLFYGAVANCVKCHGDSALGDGQLTDYDEWTKEFIGDGKDLAVVHQYEALGMPTPRTIKPRNLRLGVYRGGMRPLDIYWRLRNGIEGSPMPAVTLKPEGDPNAKGLTENDIWDIVNYVQSLPYESISNPLDSAEQAVNPSNRL